MFLKDSVRKWVKRDPVRYNNLHASMISARVGMTVEQYLWRSIKISLACGVVFGIIGYALSSLVTFQMTGRPGGIYNVLNLPVPDLILGISTVYYAQALLVIFSLIFGVYISYTALLKIPGMEKDSRKTKINLTLHNAVSYMYAMRRGGAQMMPIFRSIAERSNIYGEVALEFRQIVRDTDFFGYDVLTAIRHLAETTPSEKLKDFLEDLLSIIESGGDMAEFLSLRVRLYQEEAKFEQKQFLNTLSLIAESYVTLFVAGPLFLIIIMVVMGMMGGSAVLQLALVTYAVLPIGSIIFILFIDIISIQGEKTSRYVKTRVLRTYENVSVIKKEDEKILFQQLNQYDRIRDLIQYLRSPFETFINNVNHTLYITVPVACIYVVLIVINTPNYANF